MAKRIECSPAAVALAKALLEDGNIKSRADVNVVSPINSISRRTVQSLSLARSAIFFRFASKGVCRADKCCIVQSDNSARRAPCQ